MASFFLTLLGIWLTKSGGNEEEIKIFQNGSRRTDFFGTCFLIFERRKLGNENIII